jgi:hypothetical protein
MRFVVLLASLLAGVGACKGDAPAEIDANPAGPRCTMALYDLCIEEHDCTSGLCKNFAGDGFQVCTQPCTGGATCPNDSTGNPAECNAMMICKPAAPNMCHL